MELHILPTSDAMARAAAAKAADLLRAAVAHRGSATFVAATGNSQLAFLAALAAEPDIAWSWTTMFHLDEYIGLPATHTASFRRYLQQQLIGRVRPGSIHLIQGDAPDPGVECTRLNRLIGGTTVDVAFVGIGENGHLAFNDPPADFVVEEPFIIVDLDEACRRQQLGEGWFRVLAEVPRRAISMSIKQIMRSEAIVCTVPDRRKAEAVRACFTGEVTPRHPASILRQHHRAYVFLDDASASLLHQQ
jgi:glucosamine-6-phosphate deaminase